MRTLYLECGMGAAGDMLMAALLELHDDRDDFLARLNNAGIPGVAVTAEPSVKCGITGTRVRVNINGHEEDDEHDAHGHESYCGIESLIGSLSISDTVKSNALEVYRLIAEAESHVHGVPVNQIHFHEIGEVDAAADIIGVCMLMEELAPDAVLASPVNTGRGYVKCAHGILPVPAPATAYLLRNIPMYCNQTEGELCTPTGAALLKFFAGDFRPMPVMRVEKLGYGMGKKDFESANCVRAYIGTADGINGEVAELVCNLDDMTPEAAAFAAQVLFKEGALDVYTAPIVMKKGRAGISLTCMCRTGDKDKMLTLIFKHTSTLGVREYVCRRYALKKEITEIQTKYGTVRVKTSHGFGVRKSKPEYEDVSKIARDNSISVQDVLDGIDYSRG